MLINTCRLILTGVIFLSASTYIQSQSSYDRIIRDLNNEIQRKKDIQFKIENTPKKSTPYDYSNSVSNPANINSNPIDLDALAKKEEAARNEQYKLYKAKASKTCICDIADYSNVYYQWLDYEGIRAEDIWFDDGYKLSIKLDNKYVAVSQFGTSFNIDIVEYNGSNNIRKYSYMKFLGTELNLPSTHVVALERSDLQKIEIKILKIEREKLNKKVLPGMVRNAAPYSKIEYDDRGDYVVAYKLNIKARDSFFIAYKSLTFKNYWVAGLVDQHSDPTVYRAITTKGYYESEMTASDPNFGKLKTVTDDYYVKRIEKDFFEYLYKRTYVPPVNNLVTNKTTVTSTKGSKDVKKSPLEKYTGEFTREYIGSSGEKGTISIRLYQVESTLYIDKVSPGFILTPIGNNSFKDNYSRQYKFQANTKGEIVSCIETTSWATYKYNKVK